LGDLEAADELQDIAIVAFGLLPFIEWKALRVSSINRCRFEHVFSVDSSHKPSTRINACKAV
jgi:hypothetical protein